MFHFGERSFVNFPCCQETFRQLSSRFRAFRRPSVNFACGQETFRQLPSNFCAGGRPSMKFCQHSVRPGDLPSKFQLFGQPEDLLSTSAIFQSCRQIFCHLHSPFHGPEDFLSTFNSAGRPSVNFCQVSVHPEDLLSTFRLVGRLSSTSVSFPCGMEISINFCQLSVRPGDLPLNSVNIFCSRGTTINSVNFPCSQETFRKLLSTFRAAVGSSTNLGQLSLCPEDLLLSSINFSMWPGDLISSSVNFPCHRKAFRKLPLTFRASRRTCGREIFCQLPSTLHMAERPSVNIH